MKPGLRGAQLIGAGREAGEGESFRGLNPDNNEALEPDYPSASPAQVDRACALAAEAFETYGRTDRERRAVFLETIAAEIDGLGDALIERAMVETGLPRARLEGERGRTTGQLNQFAALLRDSTLLEPTVDEAMPGRSPLPRPRLERRLQGIGPVLVFGACNFPLAFSVAGGDTASALAAGCPVVVKAHPAHPGTSEYVGLAVARAVAACSLPEGVFSLLFDAGHDAGSRLVGNQHIAGVGFTGSRGAGLALRDLAAQRSRPPIFHAEMGSINPVFILPAALEADPSALAEAFCASLQMGAGQFCTNPGLLVVQAGSAFDTFCRHAAGLVDAAEAQVMLSPGIHDAYERAVAARDSGQSAMLLAEAVADEKPNRCVPSLFMTSAADFLADSSLQEEIFGASALIVRCMDEVEMLDVARSLEGQLTATLQLSTDNQQDLAQARSLLPALEQCAGRVLFNGWPTGVEVCAAMMHGGPFPASTDVRHTSVGTSAIERWLRPICYQNLPAELSE